LLLRSTLAAMAKEFEAAADALAAKADYAAAMLLFNKATESFSDSCDSEAADRARAKLAEATRNDANQRAVEKNRAAGRGAINRAMGAHSQGNFAFALTLCDIGNSHHESLDPSHDGHMSQNQTHP
jgi:hypothetical protein